MPSPSLFLGSCSVLFSALSFFSTPVHAATGYVLSKEYAGDSFFDQWDFQDVPTSRDDPNKGFVRYYGRDDAFKYGLASTSNGDAFMRVDDKGYLDAGLPYGRGSVKIVSQQSFYHGLIVLDLDHMPYGCGTWPAFWALGAAGDWPNSGEIDIIEGVNNRVKSLGVLHTGGQCKIAGDPRTMTGSLQSNDCYYNVQTGEGAVGCAILDDDIRSYGAAFNAGGGGVFAMEWTSDAIKIWSFPRGSVPSDIGAGKPIPSGWGLPAQIFNGPGCNIDGVIKPQKLIFNTNFCGDFGSATWTSEGCAASTGNPSCWDYVARNPQAFTNAYWQIGSLKYYQLGTVADPTTTSTATVPTTPSTVNTIVTVTQSAPTVTVTPTSGPVTNTVAPVLTGSSSGAGNTVAPILTNSQTSLAATTNTGPYLTNITPVLSTPIGSNVVSPILVSTAIPESGWNHWAEPTTLMNGIPAGQFFLPPLGSNVPITPGWEKTRAGQQPGVWLPATPIGGSTTITLTQSWVEPCETGYVTKTVHIVTTHCGCIETPVPTVPMKVVTTTCPEQWGFKTPVVMTVPDTAYATWAELPAKPTDNGHSAETWSVWASVGQVPAGKTTTWNQWSVSVPVAASTVWNEWSSYKPAPTSQQQPSWSAVTPAVATPTQGWTGLQGSATPYIAKWEGAATRSSVGAGLLGTVVAIVAFIL